jgi:iron(III) transport system substrate-binding protein
VAGLLILSQCPPSALAQSLSDLATYAGADRTEKLKALAAREGTLSVYASTPVVDMTPLSKAFEARYGIKVVHWRGGPEDILRRTVTEARGGRHDFDVVETNAPTVEAIRREALLQKVVSPVIRDIAPGVVPAHGEWVGERLNIIIGGYNTDQFRPSTLPKSWEDLKDPRFKGKLGWEMTDYDWFATVVEAMGKEKGLALFRQIAETNGISVRNGHTLLSNLVVAGEVPLSLNVFHYRVDQLARKGAPIAPLSLPPAVGRPNAIAIARQAPHPASALLYYDFMLTEGQKILLERDFTPTNIKVRPLPDMNLRIVDAVAMVDTGDYWSKLFKEIGAIKPSR